MFRPLQVTSDTVEIAGIEIFGDRNSISVCNIYHPEVKSSVQSFNHIMEQIPPSSHPFLCGDFNSHHKLWDSKKLDQKGATFVAFIEENDLVVLNDGRITFTVRRGVTTVHSALDLTITTPEIAAKCECPTNYNDQQ